MVTLPELDRADRPSPDIEAKWTRFAARVAAHEQRHVDIYLDGAKTMKTRLEAALARPASCAHLETTIRRIWAGQQAEVEESQDRFHLEDEASVETDRTPLRAQIDLNTARLTAIESEAREADLALEDLARQISATRARIDVVKTEMAPSGRSPQSRAPHLHGLRQQYDSLVTAHQALVERHHGIVGRRRALAEEHARARAVTTDLIEALNWTR